MEHQRLDKNTTDFVWRSISSAIRSAVSDCPIAMGVLVTKLTHQLNDGELSGIVSVKYIQTHVQESIMKLVSKQHIWATIMTVGERCDIYLTAPIYRRQITYRYEV